MALLSLWTELASAGRRCGEWIRWKHRSRTANYKCDSNISGNSSPIRKSSARDREGTPEECIRQIKQIKARVALLRFAKQDYGDGSTVAPAWTICFGLRSMNPFPAAHASLTYSAQDSYSFSFRK